jgi:nitrate/nitrite transporter NarK
MKVYLMNTYQADMSSFGIDMFNETNVKVIAGYFGALCIFAGAILRPVGGNIADKIGGIKALYFFYGMVAFLVIITATIELPFFLAQLHHSKIKKTYFMDFKAFLEFLPVPHLHYSIKVLVTSPALYLMPSAS